MTVSELQELLSTYHPDDEVLMAADNEGNAFSTVYGIQSEHDGKAMYSRDIGHAMNVSQREVLLAKSRETDRTCIILYP